MPDYEKFTGYFRNVYGHSFSDRESDAYLRLNKTPFRIMRKEAKFFRGAKVLEIGTGLGGFYQQLNEAFPVDYLGLELDEEAVRFTNRKVGHDIVLRRSLEEFETEERFDFIVAIEVLEHLENPLEALTKMFHLLKPGGVLIGTSPYPFARHVRIDPTHLYVLHPKNWNRLLSLSGFSQIKTMPLSFLPFLWRISPRLNIRIPFYLPVPMTVSTCLIVAIKPTDAPEYLS